MTTALLIVDVQNDFVEGGALEVKGGRKVAEDIAWSVTNHEYRYDLVITTQDFHEDPGDHWSKNPDYVNSWPVHCKAGTKGADLLPEIEKLKAIRIYKGRKAAAYSGFDGKTSDNIPLRKVLKNAGVTHVYVVGIAFDYCVKATAIDAARCGFETTILMDYTAAVNPDNNIATTTELLAHKVRFW